MNNFDRHCMSKSPKSVRKRIVFSNDQYEMTIEEHKV